MKAVYHYFNKVLEIDQIKKINQSFLSSTDYNDNPAPFAEKKVTVRNRTYKEVKDLITPIPECIDAANQFSFGFDLYPILDSFKIAHNYYDKTIQAKYDFHCDAQPVEDNYTIKLTALVNLSEQKYSGGKLELFDGSHIKQIKELDEPGSMVVFKSDTPHRVTPVENGDRMTLVIWRMWPWWR